MDADTAGKSGTGNGDARGHAAAFDSQAFLRGLDAIFDRHRASTDAEPYLQQALADAENAHDDAGLLTVLNEMMGFYRSQSRHDDNQWIIQRALELAARMGLQGTESWVTTLINAATGLRAAGRYDQARDLYSQALQSATTLFSATDRRIAALHNNLSMLYSETGQLPQAHEELTQALSVLTAASADPSTDIDVASTHTNLALVLLQQMDQGRGPRGDARLDEAERHARMALDIYRHGHHEHSAHYASALAGFAQVLFHQRRFAQAARIYRESLGVIAQCYGTDNDYYRTTAHNLREAEEQAGSASGHRPHGRALGSRTGNAHEAGSAGPSDEEQMKSPEPTTTMKGMDLARAYWNECGKPMIEEKYPQYRGRMAVGLVGHGSQCYGFDDAISQDHDFEPGFCIWLTHEDYQEFGDSLQKDYDALPDSFLGHRRAARSPRAQGGGRRLGVFEIGDFFEGITGYRAAPPQDKPYAWMMLDEPTLAAATNGQVFADPLGAFLRTRQGFTLMPDDVRLSLISRRIGMMSQAGQYNVPRMLSRADGASAWLCIHEFTQASASLVFLLNNPVTVGYMPYYKWQFAALRSISSRIATVLPDVCEQLETLLGLASSACFAGPGAGSGEEDRGRGSAAGKATDIIERICSQVAKQLRREDLTPSDETFLEWQRPYVESHIANPDPCLRSV